MALVIPIILAYRPVNLMGFFVLPGGALIFPFTYFFGDIISEVYGYKAARQILWSAIFSEIIFALASTAIISMPFPSDWPYNSAYHQVLGKSIRFVFASIVGTTVSEFINIYIISISKIRLKGRHFWARILISSATGETVLTLLVYSITFFGLYPLKKLGLLMLDGYLYKVSFSAASIIPAVLVTIWLKKVEKIDVYDSNTDFNPFKFSLNTSS